MFFFPSKEKLLYLSGCEVVRFGALLVVITTTDTTHSKLRLAGAKKVKREEEGKKGRKKRPTLAASGPEPK